MYGAKCDFPHKLTLPPHMLFLLNLHHPRVSLTIKSMACAKVLPAKFLYARSINKSFKWIFLFFFFCLFWWIIKQLDICVVILSDLSFVNQFAENSIWHMYYYSRGHEFWLNFWKFSITSFTYLQIWFHFPSQIGHPKLQGMWLIKKKVTHAKCVAFLPRLYCKETAKREKSCWLGG